MAGLERTFIKSQSERDKGIKLVISYEKQRLQCVCVCELRIVINILVFLWNTKDKKVKQIETKVWIHFHQKKFYQEWFHNFFCWRIPSRVGPCHTIYFEIQYWNKWIKRHWKNLAIMSHKLQNPIQHTR